MLSIKKLRKSFRDKVVLNNVSLDVEPGSVTVLLGESGVGKSTLLRVLNNLEKPDSGTIKLDGKQLDLNTVNQTHTVGMVFQQFNLFEHLTVLENITLALEKVSNVSAAQAKAQALSLLERFGLAEKATTYPMALSGGQKQRVALVRTLALRPRVLCMDEPTSALDPLLAKHVARIITDVAHEGLIVLVASHDVRLLRALDCTICLMQSGTIIERASSQKFADQPDNFPRIKAFVAGHQAPSAHVGK